MKFSNGAMAFLNLAFAVCFVAATLAADEPKKDDKKDDKSDATISVAEGKLSLTAPDKWKRVKPKFRMVEHEFAIPAAEGDAQDGRLMVMGAGGTVQQNIDRWVKQFDGAGGAGVTPKVDKKSVAGQLVHTVDLAGDFTDVPGPNSGLPGTKYTDYRMVAAIIESKEGNYFVKLYGPKKTIDAAEADFHKMIDGLQAK